ncbi:MAG: antitoxin, RHH family protein [Deltaproteobacteria bacterium]|nr:antitoxin, RHH family protein [Deltaproteobacteria bacterium]
MSTKNPRVMVVLENPLYRWVRQIAKHDGLSLSMKLRDLIREAYENYEDRYWSREAEKRAKSFRRSEALTHEEVWKKLGH